MYLYLSSSMKIYLNNLLSKCNSAFKKSALIRAPLNEYQFLVKKEGVQNLN